jgi:lambda family phage minor tail protein L
MTEELSIKLFEEVHKLNPSPIIELFELDSTVIGGDDILYFHNGTNGGQYDLVSFKGQAYDALPIMLKGFESSNTGEPPRPTMTISNVGGWVSSLMLATKDMVGAKVIRRRTFAKFLDGMSEAAEVEFPPDIFVIEQKVRENRVLVEFELGSGFDLDGVQFPLRQVMSTICSWQYRGDGCAFAGEYCVTNKNNGRLPGATDLYIPWKVDFTYDSGANVYYNDTLTGVSGVYRAKQTALGASQSPINASYWERVQYYRGEFDSTVSDYTKGDVVYVDRLGKRQFYYCHWASVPSPYVPADTSPPNLLYWTADICSKTMQACKYRFDPRLTGNPIPIGAYPGVLNLPIV